MGEDPLKLNEIFANKDIKSLSYARYPGTHCPLFGVSMLTSFIEDLGVLVIGTGECTYYAKGFANNISNRKDNLFSMVVSKRELTFGMEKEVRKALEFLVKIYKYKTIMIVTTCVLEVIGEDIASMATYMDDELDCIIMVVNTEHFKCDSHIIGMERTFTQLVSIMCKRPVNPKTVNILGHRRYGVEKTELMKSLIEEDVKVNVTIPSKGSIEQIQNAPSAALNIVTDFTAIPMAKIMEKKFGTPYINFGKQVFINEIDKAYAQIEETLNISLPTKDKRSELLQLEEDMTKKLKGKTFIYGNTPMMAFEICRYLCGFGMIPLIIQTREYYENERENMDKIIEMGHNPMVIRIANIAPLQKYYDELKPNFYIGHENPMSLMKNGIIQLTMDEVTEKIGYEVPILVLKKLSAILDEKEGMGDMPISRGMMGRKGFKKNEILDKGNQILNLLVEGGR